MTRREMAIMGLAAAAVDAEAAGTMPEAKFDPVAYSRERWAAAPKKLKFTAENAGAAKAWQKKLRPKVAELIGEFPARKAALNPRTIATKDFGKYTREKFVFTSREGMDVVAYLLKPKSDKPLPVMVCVPGHGRGVDDIVGIDEKGNERGDKSGYQHDFAIQFVEQGVAALAIEPLAFGYRRDPINAGKSAGQSACQPAAGAALLFGETMISWRAYDVVRAIDYIETRKDLDAKRVGCVGISGGGTCTLFAAALEPRIKVAMISGYLSLWRDCILSLSHCMDNYVPGILNWAEMPDVAGLIAPRALFCESGEKDNIFPVASAKEAFAEVKKVYEVMGAAEMVEHEIHGGPHVFYGGRGIPFAVKALNA